MFMNIYIKPSNEVLLRTVDSMSGLINELLETHFENKKKPIVAPAKRAATIKVEKVKPVVTKKNEDSDFCKHGFYPAFCKHQECRKG